MLSAFARLALAIAADPEPKSKELGTAKEKAEKAAATIKRCAKVLDDLCPWPEAVASVALRKVAEKRGDEKRVAELQMEFKRLKDQCRQAVINKKQAKDAQKEQTQ